MQSELGKFRFLNELIKVVSPKVRLNSADCRFFSFEEHFFSQYLGDKATEAVKKKVIELLFDWSQRMRYEQKIVEAYTMLKQQGIVKEDPVTAEPPLPPPSARPKNPIIEDEERSRVRCSIDLLQHLVFTLNLFDFSY